MKCVISLLIPYAGIYHIQRRWRRLTIWKIGFGNVWGIQLLTSCEQ
jgi:hypothetical protein